MKRFTAVLSVLFSQKLFACLFLVIVLGPLGFLYRPAEFRISHDLSPEKFPDVSPFHEAASGEQVWPHWTWREVKQAAADSGSEPALWFSGPREPFSFLPRSRSEFRTVEPGQPENLHEMIPELARIEIHESQLTIEDWQDVGQLSRLRLFEGCRLAPPPGDPAVGARVAADALAALPQLKQLNLLGTTWIRLAAMPQLETLILDAPDLERVLPLSDLSAQLPQLKKVILRLPPGYSLYSQPPQLGTHPDVQVLRRLQELPQLRKVELITGRFGERTFLTNSLSAFRSNLPGLTFGRGEAGFEIGEELAMIIIGSGLLFSQVAFASLLNSMHGSPQASVLPGFRQTIGVISAGLAVLVVLTGFWSASLLDLPWCFPVGLNLITVSYTGAIQRIVRLFSGSPQTVLIISWMLPPIAFCQAVVYPQVSIPMLFGDLVEFNIGLLVVAAAMFGLVLTTGKEQYAWFSEQGATVLPGFLGNETRTQAMDRASVRLQGTSVPSPRLLRGNFSDRLRAVRFGLSPQQLRLMLCSMLPFLIFMLTQRASINLSMLIGPLAGLLIIPIGMRIQSWSQRGRRMSSEFLLPIGREDFWRHFRGAVFRDFMPLFFLLLTVWVAANIWRDSFNRFGLAMLLNFLLYVGQIAFLYCLFVITIVTPKSRRRLFLLQFPMVLTLGTVYSDMLTLLSVPGADTFSPLMLPLIVLPAVAGLVLVVKLPGIMNRLELP
jgi:hypothetical protein